MSFPQAMDAEVEECSSHCDSLACAKPQKRVFAETLNGDAPGKGPQGKAAKRLCGDGSEGDCGSVSSEGEGVGCAGAGHSANSIVPRMRLCALEETTCTSENAIISASHCPKCLAGDPGHLQHMLDSEGQALMDTS